eukprot:6796620-Alexandrium_andersonii.AAC.1
MSTNACAVRSTRPEAAVGSASALRKGRAMRQSSACRTRDKGSAWWSSDSFESAPATWVATNRQWLVQQCLR